jgi:membrane protease YdiL (CAAX protease family)
MIGILLASLFFPEIGKFLTAQFVERRSRFFWVLITLGIVIFLASGTLSVIFGPLFKPPEPGAYLMPIDVLVVASAVIIFVIMLLIATLAVRG